MDTIIKSLSRHGWFGMNFYRLHLIYFLLTIIVSSVIMYGSGINGNSGNAEASFKLRYIDAIFLCTSALTNTGLDPVNLSNLTGFQQSILYLLILIGNVTVIANVTIWIRRHFLRKQIKELLQHSKSARQTLDKVGSERVKETSLANGVIHSVSSGVRRVTQASGLQKLHTSTTRVRNRHHEIGQGGIPYPWEWEMSKRLSSKFAAQADSTKDGLHHNLSFQPLFDLKGRFRSLSEREAEELGGVEYRALGVLMWLLPAYIIFWLALGMVIMIPWSYKDSVSDIIRYQQPGKLRPGWWASFVVVSGYVNSGLNLLNQNMVPFQGFYLALIITGCLNIVGNTFFPIFLRLVIWTIAKLVPTRSKLHHSLTFLLHHPRRCFILLFPSTNTWYLAAIQTAMYLSVWVFWIILQIDFPSITSISTGNRIICGLYQAITVRQSGLYIISMSEVAPALLVLYTALMYISALPVIISIRSTNVYEERSLGVQETDKKGDGSGSELSYIGVHLQRQLASDLWWVSIVFFIVCIVERDALSIPSPGFSIYAVLFETVSAFGLVGLSTGVPYDTISLCGACHTLSKLVLIVLMLKGRHRGLPMAIDRAVLLPGQELMERMDREYERTGDCRPRGEVEEEIRREESGRKAESGEYSRDLGPGKERQEKMGQDTP